MCFFVCRPPRWGGFRPGPKKSKFVEKKFDYFFKLILFFCTWMLKIIQFLNIYNFNLEFNLFFTCCFDVLEIFSVRQHQKFLQVFTKLDCTIFHSVSTSRKTSDYMIQHTIRSCLCDFLRSSFFHRRFTIAVSSTFFLFLNINFS